MRWSLAALGSLACRRRMLQMRERERYQLRGDEWKRKQSEGAASFSSLFSSCVLVSGQGECRRSINKTNLTRSHSFAESEMSASPRERERARIGSVRRWIQSNRHHRLCTTDAAKKESPNRSRSVSSILISRQNRIHQRCHDDDEGEKNWWQTTTRMLRSFDRHSVVRVCACVIERGKTTKNAERIMLSTEPSTYCYVLFHRRNHQHLFARARA